MGRPQYSLKKLNHLKNRDVQRRTGVPQEFYEELIELGRRIEETKKITPSPTKEGSSTVFKEKER